MRKFYYLLPILLLTVASVWAQPRKYKGKMNVTPLQLEQKGDSLYVRIDFDISGMKVRSRSSISLIPLLVAPQMERRLPEVMVKGRADYLCSRRQVALMSKARREVYEQNRPYTIVKGYEKGGQKQIHYEKVLPFEPWMKQAQLDIQEDLCGCGNPPRALSVLQVVNTVDLEAPVAPYVITPFLAYVEPEAEAVKMREIAGGAFLDFVVSKTDIRPDYLNNTQELKRITDMMEELKSDPSIAVRGISVVGYASPEGTLAFNQSLSEGRAKALMNYLLPRFDYPEELYRIEFGGENWDGLLAAVEASDMKYRDEVIRVLTTVPAEIDYKTNTSRKKSLMELRGGEPYRYLLKEVFPYLRKAICKIDYQVKNFDAEEAKEVFGTRPQNLSLNEIYMVANTYEPGSRESADVLETAARMFPADQTANLNAAVAALGRRDTVSAERYLVKVTVPSPEYDNAMGVLMLFKEDYPAAKEYLERASADGLESARQNLAELGRKFQNAEEINKQNSTR